jgi:hypothetical protein
VRGAAKGRGAAAKGFIVLEILIAGLILTGSIAATMYLFRMGFDYLQKANESNLLSGKLTQVTGLMRTLDLKKESGEEDVGEGVMLKWRARLLSSARPMRGVGEYAAPSLHDLQLYRVDFSLNCRGMVREYQMNVFKSRPVSSPEQLSAG